MTFEQEGNYFSLLSFFRSEHIMVIELIKPHIA